VGIKLLLEQAYGSTGGVVSMRGRSWKIRPSAIVRGIAACEDSCGIREDARMSMPCIVIADHEQASSHIEMGKEGARSFAHVFVPVW
jgi:hypothetical protein